MTIQNAIDAMNEASKNQRANYHVTLGDLIGMLEEVKEPEMTLIEYDDETSPTGPHSYRGYYSDLGLKSTDETVTARELLDTLQDALGSDFMGYKGGQFTMDERTPLWQAEWGSTGRPIMNVETQEKRLVLVLGESEF